MAMVAMAEVVVLLLLAAAFIWWFRRTPMYRAHRRSGVMPGGGQFQAGPTYYGQRTNVPLVRPGLRPDDDPVPRAPRTWRKWGSKRPG